MICTAAEFSPNEAQQNRPKLGQSHTVNKISAWIWTGRKKKEKNRMGKLDSLQRRAPDRFQRSVPGSFVMASFLVQTWPRPSAFRHNQPTRSIQPRKKKIETNQRLRSATSSYVHTRSLCIGREEKATSSHDENHGYIKRRDTN
jgi:hypothetical protein